MVDLVVTATSVVKVSGSEERLTLGGTVTAGQAVKYTASVVTVANDDSAANAACYGIALSGGAIGQPVIVQKDGIINVGATLAVGKIYVVSTSGGIAPVDDIAGSEFITILGVALTTANLKLTIIQSGVAAAGAVS